MMAIELTIQSGSERQVVYTSSKLLRIGGAKENELHMPELPPGLLTVQCRDDGLRLYQRAEGQVELGRLVLTRDQMHPWPAGKPLNLPNGISLVWAHAKPSRKNATARGSSPDEKSTTVRPKRFRQFVIVALGMIITQAFLGAASPREDTLKLIEALSEKKHIEIRRILQEVGLRDLAKEKDVNVYEDQYKALERELDKSDTVVDDRLKARLKKWVESRRHSARTSK